MRRLFIALGLLAITWVLGTLVVSELKLYINSASLILSGTSNQVLENIVRKHIEESVLHDGIVLEDTATIKIKTAHVNADLHEDIIATTESKSTCGTGGCITTIYLQDEFKQFDPISFAYAVKEISVENGITNGMHDLQINNGDTRMVWNGESYALESF